MNLSHTASLSTEHSGNVDDHGTIRECRTPDCENIASDGRKYCSFCYQRYKESYRPCRRCGTPSPKRYCYGCFIPRYVRQAPLIQGQLLEKCVSGNCVVYTTMRYCQKCYQYHHQNTPIKAKSIKPWKLRIDVFLWPRFTFPVPSTAYDASFYSPGSCINFCQHNSRRCVWSCCWHYQSIGGGLTTPVQFQRPSPIQYQHVPFQTMGGGLTTPIQFQNQRPVPVPEPMGAVRQAIINIAAHGVIDTAMDWDEL